MVEGHTALRQIEIDVEAAQDVGSEHSPSSPKPEQVDLILGDPQSGFILVCELRSMITPGDPREIYDRIKDYAKKVGQAERKLEAARRVLSQICGKLGLDATRDWKFGGIVILDGAAGVPSSKPNSIPIVEKRVFIKVLTLTKNLELTHAILCSPLWLPREGSDFQRERIELDVCGFRFRQGTFTLTDQSYCTIPSRDTSRRPGRVVSNYERSDGEPQCTTR